MCGILPHVGFYHTFLLTLYIESAYCKFRMKNPIIQDQRHLELYGDDPVVVSGERIKNIISYYSKSYEISENNFNQNYLTDFVRYLANYRSISGNVIKPWDDANEYFMPSTNITIENYVARMMETVRGGRDFLTVIPRGRDDKDKSRLIELYLRYTFEQPMKGYQKLVDNFRTKLIYGTSIATIPWNLDLQIRKIPGKYIFDTFDNSWVKDSQNQEVQDFTGIDTKTVLDENPTFVLKDLMEEVKVKDHPDLEIHDIFNVKVDPAGGKDINDHAFTIIESIETLDTVNRKVAQNIYDADQAKKLRFWLNTDKARIERDEFFRTVSLEEKDTAHANRASAEGLHDAPGVQNGIRIWTCYGRHVLDGEFEDETIAIIAEKNFLLRFTPTHFRINGIPYRPILVDRFITLPHRFYGIGIGEILEPLNYLLNHSVNQILNHGDTYNSPPLIYPESGNWDPEHNMFGPGQTWQSDNPEGFKILATPDIKTSQVQMITFFEGFIQKSLGISDFTSGGGSGSIVNNQTAHGLANILRETNRRIDFYAQNSHETFIRDMYEMMLKESQQFLDVVEIPKITDIQDFNFEEIFNKDIQGFYDIKIFADSLTSSKEFEQLKWLQLLPLFAQLTGQGQQPLYDVQKMGDRVLEAYGEPFPETFHNTQPNPLAGLIPGSGQGQQDISNTPDVPSTSSEGASIDSGGLGNLNPEVG